MFWLLVLLGLAMFADVGGELNVEPGHLIAVVGRRAVLSCTQSADQSLEWRRRQIRHSLPSNPISAEGRPYTVEAVDEDGRRRLDVVLEPVQWNDAMDYQCQYSSGKASPVLVQLVVLAAVPDCTTEVLGDLDLAAGGHLSMRCTLNWTANFDPAMPWFDVTGEEFLRTGLSAAVAPTPLEQRRLVARPVTNNVDNQTKWFELSLTSDRTEPGYAFNWSSANVDVSMSVRNVRIRSAGSNCCSSGEENLLNVGDQLVCEADGPTGMRYIWDEVMERAAPSVQYNSMWFRLSRTGQYVIRCTVSHHMRGVHYNASAQISVRVLAGDFLHTTPTMSGSSEGVFSLSLAAAVVFVVIFVVVVVVVTVVFVVVHLRAKPRERQRTTDSNDETIQPYTLHTATPAPEQPLPDARRLPLPLPTASGSDISQHNYEDMEREINRVTQDSPVDEPPTTDDTTPGDECVRLQSDSDVPDTTPKSFYEPLNLELQSSDGTEKLPTSIAEYTTSTNCPTTPQQTICTA